MVDMSASIFQPLPVDADSIKLLLLQPSSQKRARIKCSRTTTQLSRGYSYEAVSYTWGAPLPSRQIFVDNQALEIGDNLYHCLLRLRHPHRTRALWIDATCIRQSSLVEKGHQIKLMPKIYSHAANALAWLGEDANNSELLVP